MRELATLGIDRGSLIAALQAQNIVRPSGVIQTGNEFGVGESFGWASVSGMASAITSPGRNVGAVLHDFRRWRLLQRPLWVETGDHPIPRKFVITSKATLPHRNTRC